MARRAELVVLLAIAVLGCRANFEQTPDALLLDVGNGNEGSIVLTGNRSTMPCRALLDGSQSTLRFAAVDSLAAGMKLFVWQVQDHNVSVSGDALPITNPGAAGRWEFVTIESVGDVDVTLTAPLTYEYSSAPATAPARRAQACTIRQYENVEVPAGSVLATPAWNGDVGGVLVMFVSGTLELAGTIDVAGAGFRGGGDGDPCATTTTELDPSTCAGGKGEGLDGAAWGILGRGNRANGGGGGNAYNAGGGGGGNGGVGGPGGIECCGMTPGTGGMPGVEATTPVVERIVFGGGGGQGHSNSTVSGGSGGAGGGLVIVHAGSITGAGSIDADGRSGISIDSDGGGGGGAGGTIILRAIASTFAGTLLARGGGGGDVTDGDSNPDVHGPGGGGGGGRIAIEGVPAATIVVLGGASGMDALDPRGAGPGAEGQIEQQ